uniref:Uncharacterized protein n=1 Tax=Rhizophora mucronata TaxID=61149 RepID=A0A2P2NK71_RHIMU
MHPLYTKFHCAFIFTMWNCGTLKRTVIDVD